MSTRNIDKLKQLLKDTAKSIRETRSKHKEAQRGRENWEKTTNLLYHLHMLQHNYRHHHIAYCLLRGRTIDQIESRVREDNKRDELYIQRLMSEYAWSEEDIKIYNERKAKYEKALHTN